MEILFLLGGQRKQAILQIICNAVKNHIPMPPESFVIQKIYSYFSWSPVKSNRLVSFTAKGDSSASCAM